jgi:hypothetical protein
MNASRHRTVRTPANYMPSLQLWNDVVLESGLFQLRVLQILHDNQMHPYQHSRSTRLYQTIGLYGNGFANGYIHTLQINSLYVRF